MRPDGAESPDPGQGDRGAAVATPSPSPAPSPAAPPTRHDEPSAARALALATRLATEIGPRAAGTAGDAPARELVTAWMLRAGWDVAEQVVPLPQGGETANLVATWEGRGPGGPHVVIGAHLDTVAPSPGANDNGSGVGALVALAEELADEAADLPVPVVLVAFGAEEYQPVSPRVHHLGSDRYAAEHGGDVLAMISIDMMGNGPETCICWLERGPSTLATRLRTLAPGEGYRARSPGDISDHGPFARRGIPAVMLWTGMDDAWHSPRDTPGALDEDDLARSLRLLAAFVRSLDDADLDGLRAEAS